jgi:16S rRNA (cytidine1402-2'-O)-methyltransferase
VVVTVNLSVDLALQAARSMAGDQHYPPGCLYVVATPIGNLADITFRALCTLSKMDAIACEDTRHTGALLRGYGLASPLIAVHEHNEAEAAQGIVQRLQSGERIAYVSDAGTPGVSDPGSRLCEAARTAGIRCIPLPGASSVTALVSVAGLAQGQAGPAFEFTGFLPHKGADREAALRRVAQQAHACVVLESPHRISALARDLANLSGRLVTVGRELTKQFEEVATLACRDLPEWLEQDDHRHRGEFVLVLHPVPPSAHTRDELPADARRTLELLLQELPVKTAARLCASITGLPKNTLYQAALNLRQDQD